MCTEKGTRKYVQIKTKVILLTIVALGTGISKLEKRLQKILGTTPGIFIKKNSLLGTAVILRKIFQAFGTGDVENDPYHLQWLREIFFFKFYLLRYWKFFRLIL